MRVVSLLASSTEIEHALGAGSLLVGRSHECDYPESVTSLPSLTAPKFRTDVGSSQIDQSIKAIIRDGLSVYRVDADRLSELRPDLVITQTQCEVCAVSERDVEAALHEYAHRRPAVLSLRPDSLADVWRDIERVAMALERPEAGRNLVSTMRSRMARISEAAHSRGTTPGVACIEWIDPLMAAGNWMPELVDMAGGRNIPWKTWDDLRSADPDVIFVSPCGYDVPTTEREMSALVSLPGWSDLRAVRTGRVVIADGNQYFHRPGPRLVESLEILARAVHPEAMP